MTTPKLSREQLGVKQGDSIIVRGVFSYARLDKLVEGEALRKENELRAQQGRFEAQAPFRSITIENPEIVEGKDTPLGKFHADRFYTTKDGATAMSLESKSPYPPAYAIVDKETLVGREIVDPQKNPARGQEALIQINAYGGGKGKKIGSSFNAIGYLVNEGEDIQFYTKGNSIAGFGKNIGVKIKPLTQEEIQAQEKEIAKEANVTEEQPAESPQEAVAASPFQDAPAFTPEQQAPAFGKQDNDVVAEQPANPFAAPNQAPPANPFSAQ